jgi:putative hemolysin
MGSSLTPGQSVVLACVCGVFYLLFDAARTLTLQLGPMRLRRWNSERDAVQRGLFHYSAQTFSLLSGTVVQLCLVGGAIFTALVFTDRGIERALLEAALLWIAVIFSWKVLLTLVPDWIAERALIAIIPVGNVFYVLLWPLLYPIRALGEGFSNRRDEAPDEEEVTDEEVQAFIDVGEEEGILEEGEGELVQSIVDFGDKIARELMTPRIDMMALEVDTPLDVLARQFSESKYSRIPVYEQNIDRIIGIVHIKDVFEAYLRNEPVLARQLARPAHMVSETKKVSELLRDFQRQHLQVAVVIDEYGGTSGLITVEDLIEEIVGDISDEHEDKEESAIVSLGERSYMVSGQLKVEELEEVIGGELAGDGDYETVAGLIFTELGRVPRVGERVVKNGFVFEVDRADRKRIYRVRVAPDVPGRRTEDEEE